jgi:hypothetical protein
MNKKPGIPSSPSKKHQMSHGKEPLDSIKGGEFID